MIMYMHGDATHPVPRPRGPGPASHRRRDEVGGTGRRRHRRDNGHPPIRGVAAPAYPGGRRHRADAPGRAEASLLAAQRGVRPARRLGGGISPSLGGTARPIRRRACTTAGHQYRLAGEIMMIAPSPARGRFSIERTYACSIDEAWTLWTTQSGLESWWGPEGF